MNTRAYLKWNDTGPKSPDLVGSGIIIGSVVMSEKRKKQEMADIVNKVRPEEKKSHWSDFEGCVECS